MTLSKKKGGGLAMSKILSEITYDYNFIYFTSSQSKEVNISVQIHHNQKLSACFDIDLNQTLIFSTFECPN